MSRKNIRDTLTLIGVPPTQVPEEQGAGASAFPARGLLCRGRSRLGMGCLCGGTHARLRFPGSPSGSVPQTLWTAPSRSARGQPLLTADSRNRNSLGSQGVRS